MDTVKVGRCRRPDAVAGDKGYSYPRIRRWCARRGIEAVIPTKKNKPRESFSRRKYRRRNTVERYIGWLKCCRRIATRHEKLASSFKAMATLALIQCCLRILDPRDRT